MLETLDLVFGAVATKDIVPILCHVCIYPGRMQGGDGTITIDAPFECDLAPCAVPGQKFLNSVKACKGKPNLSLTDGGKLSVKKGSFKAYLSILPAENFPTDQPRGDSYSVPSDLMKVLKTLKPFISKDASRPWSMGVRFSDNFAYATNNVILARVPVDWPEGHPTFVIPSRAVDALLELAELPSQMNVDENSATFTYNDDSWLKTQLRIDPWPDVGAMLGSMLDPDTEVPGDLLDAVQRVKKFCTNQKFPQVMLSDRGVSSDDGGGDIASIEGFDVPESRFNGDMLEIVLLSATHVDFSHYPKPCTFSGKDGLFGIFVGMLA